MKYYLIFCLIFFSNSIFAQKFLLEELIVLNQKSEYSLSGILQKNHWKHHYTKNDSNSLPRQYYSKKMTEDPYSLEIIKHTSLPLHNDSYIELIILDSIRWEVLKLEAEKKFTSQHTELKLNDKKIDVYLTDKYAFLFYKKTSTKNKLTRFHISIYNLSTYNALMRQQEFMEFWGED